MNNETTFTSWDCVSIAWELAIGQKITKLKIAASSTTEDDKTNCYKAIS